MFFKMLGWVAAALIGAAMLVSPAAAQVAPAGHALTADDVGAYFDGLVPFGLSRGDIAGAVVVVVKDGQVLFEKGYGVSDEATQKPVDPKVTMFRPGSVSKLFTWTAVMQLQEQGKLDLDRDVNAYLDFTVPHTWNKPVTLRDLMTHTPGFEETIKHLFMTDPKGMKPLGDLLKAWVPEEIFPPGEVPAYSNYGAALAGYIVQRVSGERFEDYVTHHIFAPLGMTHSTFVQPLPASLQGDMSKGYKLASGTAQPFEFVNPIPAGALSASGEDIARFMIAHLNDGAYGGAQILKPETARLMHRFLYQRVPPLPGMALGFYHEDRNGYTVIAHGGDTVLFHSDLALVLDKNVGLFVSQNSAGKPGAEIRRALFDGFMDRYFPAPPLPPEPTLKSAKTDGALVAGTYEISRRSQSNFFVIADLAQEPTVTVNDDGTLSVDVVKDAAGNTKKWREIHPFVWREVNARHLLIARVTNGKVNEIVNDGPQVWTAVRPPFWRNSDLAIPLLLGTLVMLFLTLVFWPIKAILRWRYGQSFPYKGRAATLYRLTRLVVLIDFVFLVGFFAFLQYGSDHLEAFGDPGDKWLRLLQIVGLIGVIGVIFPLAEIGTAFGDRERPWWTKLTDVLVAVACVATVWFAFTLHLLSFSLNY